MIERAPISLCLIVRDEPLLEQCLNSIKDYVSEIVIVDTGSTDNTPEIAKKYADIFEVYTDCNNSETGLIESFSQARQRSFDLATQPWVLWVDADDIITKGENLLKIIQDYLPDSEDKSVCLMFPYEYAYDSNGKCTCYHYRERLVYNKDRFHWVNPVHEVLINKDPSCFFQTVEDVLFKHQRYLSKKVQEFGRNLRILRSYFEKHGDSDPRQLYYLGLECYNANLMDEAIERLSKYIDVSGWDDERAMACLKLIDIYQMRQDYESALKWAFKTVAIKESWAEGYLALGRIFYYLAQQGGRDEIRNWERCVYFIKLGLGCSETKTLLFINPADREYEIHKYYNFALNKLGRIEEALDSVNRGLRYEPTEPAFLLNKRLYEINLLHRQIYKSIKELEKIGELDAASISLMTSIIDKKVIIKNKADEDALLPQKVDEPIAEPIGGKLDIIFFAGNGVEIWTPISVKQFGIGGSETMLIEQAKRLAALGHRVRVYNSCGNNEGIYDRVEYYRTEKYANLECDILVVSRHASMLADKYNVKAKVTLLWVHDVIANGATSELLLKTDKVLALSDWHKNNIIRVHNINPEQVSVTRNGIDLNRFNKKVPRNRFKAVNSSSPDRSWPILLECWTTIKAHVPKAELHLFYGFKNWEYSAQYDQGQADLISRLKKQIKDMESLGVFYHDRVNQDELAIEFLSAGCWIHPTWFTETSCITAMEAQAAGLRMVTSSIAALNETVGERGTLIPGDWTTSEYKNNFISAVINAMFNNSEDDRLVLQEYAKENFGLDSLAKDWEKMFYDMIEKSKTDPMIPYYPTTPYRK